MEAHQNSLKDPAIVISQLLKKSEVFLLCHKNGNVQAIQTRGMVSDDVKECIVDTQVSDLLPGRFQEQMNNIMMACNKDSGIHSFSFPLETPEITRNLEIRAVCLGEPQISVEIQDVTFQKRAEQELRGSKEFLQSVFDAIQDGISVLTPDFTVLETNRWMEKMYAGSMPLKGKKCYQVYQNRTTVCPWCPTAKTLKTGKMQSAIVPYPSEENPKGWIELTIFPVKDENDEITSVIEYVKDITDKVNAERELKDVTALLELVFDAFPDFIGVYDEKLQFIRVNRAAAQLFGIPSEELVGKTCQELQADFQNCESCPARTTIETKKSSGIEVYDEKSDKWWDIRVYPIFNDEGQVVRVVEHIRDITDFKRNEQIQQALRRTQKLESLGILAGGIAHDFNNLLMAIMGNVDLALLNLPVADPVHEFLDEIKKGAKEAANVSKQLLAYAGKGSFLIKPVALDDVVKDIAKILRVAISKKAILKLDLHQPVPYIRADPTQMRQIAMNLVINASEALPPLGGHIFVRTGLHFCDEESLSKSFFQDKNLKPGNFIFLEVEDEGVGMDNTTLKKIFDPFFTTKFVGRGLGLPAVIGIVRAHEGWLIVESGPNRGTRFQINFPVSAALSEKRDETTMGKTSDWKGGGKILLVDDEESVRRVGTRMLERLGFSVLLAEDGYSALKVFEADHSEIQCVILDLSMPGLDGKEVLRGIQAINPQVPVIISSGYNEQAVFLRKEEVRGTKFIQKPYSISDLEKMLQEVLEIEKE